MRPVAWRTVTAPFVVLVALSPSTSCGGGSQSSAGAAPQAAQDAREWAEEAHPSGFTLEHPRDWQVRRDDGTGRIDLTGRDGEAAVIWPLMAQPQAAAGTFDAATAAALLGQMAGRLWPDARWQQPEPLGPGAIRIRGARGDAPATAALTWVASPRAVAAFVWGTSAPEADGAALADVFARIFSSFRLAGEPAAAAGAPRLRYVPWRDPNEQAFTLQVPQGWQVGGGLARYAAVDTRVGVEATSADGAIRVTIGDPSLPPFTEPSQMLAMAGFPEGSWYSPGYGVQMQVLRYLAGRDFVARYVQENLGQLCEAVSIEQLSDRDDAVRAINAVYAQYGTLGVIVNLSAGEAHFTCRRPNGPARGYTFAATQSTRGYGTGLWNVEHLYGFLASPERAAEAQQALTRMIGSFELDPQWVSMQQHLTAQVSHIVTQTNSQISDLIVRGFEERSAVYDEIARRRSNATLGLQDVIDEATGQPYRVESGSSYYWIDHRGNIVGTDTYTLPGIDFRELLRLR